MSYIKQENKYRTSFTRKDATLRPFSGWEARFNLQDEFSEEKLTPIFEKHGIDRWSITGSAGSSPADDFGRSIEISRGSRDSVIGAVKEINDTYGDHIRRPSVFDENQWENIGGARAAFSSGEGHIDILGMRNGLTFSLNGSRKEHYRSIDLKHDDTNGINALITEKGEGLKATFGDHFTGTKEETRWKPPGQAAVASTTQPSPITTVDPIAKASPVTHSPNPITPTPIKQGALAPVTSTILNSNDPIASVTGGTSSIVGKINEPTVIAPVSSKTTSSPTISTSGPRPDPKTPEELFKRNGEIPQPRDSKGRFTKRDSLLPQPNVSNTSSSILENTDPIASVADSPSTIVNKVEEIAQPSQPIIQPTKTRFTRPVDPATMARDNPDSRSSDMHMISEGTPQSRRISLARRGRGEERFVHTPIPETHEPDPFRPTPITEGIPKKTPSLMSKLPMKLVGGAAAGAMVGRLFAGDEEGQKTAGTFMGAASGTAFTSVIENYYKGENRRIQDSYMSSIKGMDAKFKSEQQYMAKLEATPINDPRNFSQYREWREATERQLGVSATNTLGPVAPEVTTTALAIIPNRETAVMSKDAARNLRREAQNVRRSARTNNKMVTAGLAVAAAVATAGVGLSFSGGDKSSGINSKRGL